MEPYYIVINDSDGYTRIFDGSAQNLRALIRNAVASEAFDVEDEEGYIERVLNCETLEYDYLVEAALEFCGRSMGGRVEICRSIDLLDEDENYFG